MTTDNIAYATSTAITVTAPATSTTAGQCCTALDNTSFKYDDAMVMVQVVQPAGALTNSIYNIYVYGSEDGTNYNISTNEMASPGTNAAITFDVPTNLKGPVPMSIPAASKTYTQVIGSIASFFGGVMPRKWGICVQNNSGQTATTLTCTYTGITYTNT